MVERCLLPAVFFVTGLTFLSVTTMVLIVSAVTAVAIFCGFFLSQCLSMAGVTGDMAVSPPESEIGFLVMVEIRLLPFRRSMAFLAFFSVATIMCIIQGVTADALTGDILVALTCMAATASHLFVLAL